MLFSSQLIIGASEKIAVAIGIPIFVVGLVILAIGTSLPEFVFSLKSINGTIGTIN
jgi:Ca2+/Na+ antiporter